MTANCVEDGFGGSVQFENETLSRLECNNSAGYFSDGSDCVKQLIACSFDGQQYSDGQTVTAYQYKTSATCSEQKQKVCDGNTGTFNYPAYTQTQCNMWCIAPSGWTDMNGLTKVDHGASNTMNLYQDLIVGNSTVRWVKYPQAGSSCHNGAMAFDAIPTAYWTEYTDVDAGTLLSDLPQNSTVDLDNEFTITIALDSVPTIGT